MHIERNSRIGQRSHRMMVLSSDIVNIIRGFGRPAHATKELIVFGHVETKVHSGKCLHSKIIHIELRETQNHRIWAIFFTMPGANCSIFGCMTSRKHSGVGIFKIPAETDELSKKTRKAWISVITKDRVVDESLRRQINSGNLYVCDKHFRKEEYK